MSLTLLRGPATLAFALAATSLLHAIPSVTDFFKRPELTAPTVSKDGRYVAYLTPNAGKYYDFNVFDFTRNEPLKFDLKGEDVYGYYWLDEHQVVLFTQKLPLYWSRQVIFDLNKRKLTCNLNTFGVYYRVVSAIKDRPGFFYAFYPASRQNRPEIAIIDAKRTPLKMGGINNSRFNIVGGLSIPPGEFHGLNVDLRGEIRIARLYRNGGMHYDFRGPGDQWSELPLDPLKVAIKAFTSMPGEFYVTNRDPQTGASSLHLYNATRNEMGPSLFSDADYSLDNSRVMLTEDGKELLGLTYERDRVVQVLFSPVLREILARANAALPDRNNLIMDYDEKLTRFVLHSATDRDMRHVLCARNDPRGLSQLAEPFPQLPAQALRPMTVVHYQTRDDLQLEGYLTLPDTGYGAPKPPLVVLPHGGPWVRDVRGFDRQVQFLASRGYAVFQPNYRGSIGYSKAVSLDGEFAFRKMHDDVTDGVRHILGLGQVDPARVGIFGASFGGYLALCGVAFDPDLYRCAVSFAGVFDWKQLIAQQGESISWDRFNYEFLIQRLGDPEKNRALFEEISPVNHVGNIKVPVFVVHGKEDETVDVSQSKRLRAELKKHHVPFETLFFANEGHGFDEQENEVKFFTAVEAFLDKNLKFASTGTR